MFGIGIPELIIIFIIALIIFGPRKLPELGKSLGRGLSEFKKATQEFKDSIEGDARPLHSNAPPRAAQPLTQPPAASSTSATASSPASSSPDSDPNRKSAADSKA